MVSKEADLKPDIELQPHQQAVLDRLQQHPGNLLLMHALGSGKTPTGIAASEQTGEPYTFISPASLRVNTRRELEKFTDDPDKADIKSYSELALGKPVQHPNVLVFDEAHRLRNPGSLQTQRAMELARRARQTLLMTGTPVVNDPTDLAVPMSMLTGREYTPKYFSDRFLGKKTIRPGFLNWLRGVHSTTEPTINRRAELKHLLEGKVDYCAPPQSTVPTTHEDVEVEMSPDQSNLYQAMWGKLPWLTRWKLSHNYPLDQNELRRATSFLVGPRQVGLSTYTFMGQDKRDPLKAFEGSTKLQAAFQRLQEKLKDARAKSLVFSNFIDAGLTPYAAGLAKAGIPAAVFHGGLSDLERKKLVDDYNAGRIRVALLGPSGAEGLSFKGTQLVQLLDPYWNSVRGKQSEGRALRYDSHWNLPEELQNVAVQRFISKLPLGFKDRLLSHIGFDRKNNQRAADDYLMNMASRKDKLNQQFIELLKEVGTEPHLKQSDTAVSKQAAFAPGIPSKTDMGDLSQLQAGQLLDYVVQKHQARRAGLHYDVRFGNPEMGMHSWAVRKGVPAPGSKHLAIHQPIHSHEYGGFEGEIPSGYGAGTVAKQDEGKVLVTKVHPDAIHFTTAHRRYPERFALIRPKPGADQKKWLLINTTKTEAIPYQKVHYATIPAEQAEEALKGLEPGSSVQAKIDGAASLTKLYKDHFEVVSYRAAKAGPTPGGPIVHTERVFAGRPEYQAPRGLAGTVLRGELYGTDRAGKGIPPQSLGGLLNSGLAKSINDQKTRGHSLSNLLFDVQRVGNKSTTGMPYDQRLAKVREIASTLPKQFTTPEEAKTPDAAVNMWQNVVSGKNPLTHEGVVVHPLHGRPYKIKQRGEHDVYVREFFPGKGKYEGTAVGGFRYSHAPTGDIVGEVGTGLSDHLRRDMFTSPQSYIGRVARVIAQEKHPSGALRAPALISMHEDLPMASVTPTKEG